LLLNRNQVGELYIYLYIWYVCNAVF
jgi:hypothetical protein